MEKRLSKVLILIVLFFAWSCSEDDDYNDAVYVGFGLALEDSSNPLGFTIKMDDGDYLIPVAPTTVMDEVEDSTRLLVYYEVISSANPVEGNDAYTVEILELDDILMKGIIDITPEIEDSIGNDPIIVRQMWVTGDLLNFELKFWGGNTKKHMVNLVKQPGEITAEDMPIQLELRHNAFDDPKNYLYSGYVSFNLSSLKLEGLNAVSFTVNGTDYYLDDYEYDGIYKYGGQ